MTFCQRSSSSLEVELTSPERALEFKNNDDDLPLLFKICSIYLTIVSMQ